MSRRGSDLYVLVPYELLADLFGLLRMLESDWDGERGLTTPERAKARALLRRTAGLVRDCYGVTA